MKDSCDGDDRIFDHLSLENVGKHLIMIIPSLKCFSTPFMLFSVTHIFLWSICTCLHHVNACWFFPMKYLFLHVHRFMKEFRVNYLKLSRTHSHICESRLNTSSVSGCWDLFLTLLNLYWLWFVWPSHDFSENSPSPSFPVNCLSRSESEWNQLPCNHRAC